MSDKQTDASYDDPIKHGGNWDAETNWKKLREKHAEHKKTGKWKPTEWDGGRITGGAGKGDKDRHRQISKELYDLNFDLAFGNITREEYDHKLSELDT
jgi:hypothetical protein